MKDFDLALIQFCPRPGGISGNLDVILGSLEREADRGAGIISFPECSLTGYTVENASVSAVFADDGAIRRIREAASERGVIASFGFLEKEGEKLFISHMITGPAGTVVYRKTHLGSREMKVFESGDELIMYCSEEIRIGVCLCWESHIPEIASVYRSRGAQLMLVPYASGMKGERCRELWMKHLPARASDNGMFVAACNGLRLRDGTAAGGIAVFDPKGELCAGSFEGESVVNCRIGGTLPREGTEDMRHISYFDHRRPELYHSSLESETLPSGG